MKFPADPNSEEEPGYDFAGILRDHITPGGMYKEPVNGNTRGARIEGVKVRTTGLSAWRNRGQEKDEILLRNLFPVAGRAGICQSKGAGLTLILCCVVLDLEEI